MKLAFTIAKRYLFAKKSQQLINVISGISVLGVCVGSFGLIVVLSVFNGFGNLVLSLYNSFDPDIRITVSEGRFFDPAAPPLKTALNDSGITAVTRVLEENALLRYMERQYVVTLKGMSSEFTETSGIAGKIIDGSAELEDGPMDYMVAGAGVAYALGLRVNDPIYTVTVIMPQKGIDPSTALIDPSSAFMQQPIITGGVFSIQQDFDTKYALVPLRFMRTMTDETQRVSALELRLKPDIDAARFADELQTRLGEAYTVKDRLRQHDFLYQILRSEKVAVYLILGFILLIAAFNIFGTLTMLVLDKSDDLQTLFRIGADMGLARRIFLLEGLLISVGGGLTGMAMGALLCGLQQRFGLIRIGSGEGFVAEAYPVAMQAGDFVLVFLIVLGIGFSAAWYTSGHLVRKQADPRLLES
jgi:lipoprotein-releasing system permease protein